MRSRKWQSLRAQIEEVEQMMREIPSIQDNISDFWTEHIIQESDGEKSNFKCGIQFKKTNHYTQGTKKKISKIGAKNLKRIRGNKYSCLTLRKSGSMQPAFKSCGNSWKKINILSKLTWICSCHFDWLFVSQHLQVGGDAARTATFRTHESTSIMSAAVTGEVEKPPVVQRPPQWGWQTLGDMAFAHTGQANFHAENLPLLSKFPLIQFDKKELSEDLRGMDAIDRFTYAARTVRANHTSSPVQILLYLNGLIDFPAFQHIHNKTIANQTLLLWGDSGKFNGRLLKIRHHNVFDIRNPQMRKVFVDAALYGMSTRMFDGVFIDRANWCDKSDCRRRWYAEICASMAISQRILLAELTSVLGEKNLVVSKLTSGTFSTEKDWQVANAAMLSDTFCSHYCNNRCSSSSDPASSWTHPEDSQNCVDAMVKIQEMSARGQLTQSHAMGPLDGPYAEAAREFTMASFLIAVGNLSYFTYVNWSDNSWALAGTRWWSEYDKKLGAPTSPPNTRLPGELWKYSRTFASGTTVYVDIATRQAKINWA